MQYELALNLPVSLNAHTQDDSAVAAILLSKLSPNTLELCIGWAALGDDAAVPTRVVVLQMW